MAPRPPQTHGRRIMVPVRMGNRARPRRKTLVDNHLILLDSTLMADTKQHAYILRGIDRKLWKRVVERAEREGHDVRWVLLRMLENYASEHDTVERIRRAI